MQKKQVETSLAVVARGMTNEEVDLIVNKVILGLPAKFIASDMGCEVKLIEDIKRTKEFREKLRAVIEEQRELSFVPWKEFESKKLDLVKNAMALALDSDDEKVKASMTTWCLERFPEFSIKNVANIGKELVHKQLSSEDVGRIEQTSKKLISVLDTLKYGNPNIVTVREMKIESNPLSPNKTEVKYERFKDADGHNIKKD